MTNRLIGQAVGLAGSVGANYREANDTLDKKDFIMRLKISRKEANPELKLRMKEISQEVREIKNILSAIIDKTSNKTN